MGDVAERHFFCIQMRSVFISPWESCFFFRGLGWGALDVC